MPPLYPQDPLSALQRGDAWRWVDVPVALADVASQGWVLALVALALYAWLEREVNDVVEVFVPLAAGLATAAGLALLARLVGAVPRPVGADEARAGAALLRALASGQAAAVAVFATYSLLAYGRRARPALLFALLFAAARVVAGPHWAADLAAGAAVGAGVAGAVFLGGILLFPRGRLARLRSERRIGTGAALAGPRSP
jgi:membrane-associated phospholipid phosphatase